jgi:hypothetical protein
MNDRPDPRQPRRRRQRSQPRTESEGAPDAARPAGVEMPELPLKGSQSLERLRDRVELAARELVRLRQENEALARRIAGMEQSGSSDDIGLAMELGEDPESLRRKVAGFVEAIDRYLESKDVPEMPDASDES